MAKNIDKENMREVIISSPEQLIKGLDLAKDIKKPNAKTPKKQNSLTAPKTIEKIPATIGIAVF